MRGIDEAAALRKTMDLGWLEGPWRVAVATQLLLHSWLVRNGFQLNPDKFGAVVFESSQSAKYLSAIL